MDSEQQKAARAIALSDVSAIGQDSAVRGGIASNANMPLAAMQADGYMRFRDTPVDNYLIGRNLIADAGSKPTLFQTTAGRIATRLVSRGVFGAIAFTWAQGYSGRAMRNYDPKSITSFTEWRQALLNPKADPEHIFVNKPNTMQAIAKSYDVVFGAPIKMVARTFAPAGLEEKWAAKSVLFRQRTMHADPVSTYKNVTERVGGYNPYEMRQMGRSLGAEIVGVTSDFAAASFADSLTRNIIDTCDPNNTKARKAWKDEQGHFSPKNFAWDWTKRLWRVASFNMGEDWAVALPYVYFIKWHRNVIDHFSPGFKLASDNPSWQAASDKLHLEKGKDGSLKLVEAGDFQKEGAWDLQARFVMYNVFTLMFRETYTNIGQSISTWWKGDHWLPSLKMPHNPVAGAVEAAGDAARYSAKSFIKANLYMQPAVPFFWAFRTSQSKWQSSPIITKGLDNPVILTRVANDRSIHKDLGANTKDPLFHETFNSYLAYNDTKAHVGHRSNDDNVRLHMWRHHGGEPVVYAMNQPITEHGYAKSRELFDDATTNTLFTAFTKPLGRLSFNTGGIINDMVQKNPTARLNANRLFGQKTKDVKPETLSWQAEKSIRTAVDASFSYTPYMIAKAETAMRWDTPDMDKAAYRLIDGVMSFNVSEVKKAISEIGDLLVHPRVKNDDKDAKPTPTIDVANLDHKPMQPRQRVLH